MPTRHFVVIREKSCKATGVKKTLAILAFLFDEFYFFEIGLGYVHVHVRVHACVCVCDHNKQ